MDATESLIGKLHPLGLHFAFIDPYNLEALDFRIVAALSELKRIDMLVHVSKMDLQRNLGFNLTGQQRAFDVFAPGWRDAVQLNQSQKRIRGEVFEYWQGLIIALGVWPSTEMRLIVGKNNQPLYWLLMAAKHNLPQQFWKVASQPKQQSFI